MAFHPDNRDVYREIKNALPRLVPFVGAGLTQFAYCSWPNALRKLSDKLTDSKNLQRVHDLINSGCYLDAAQLLEDLRTPTNLARDIANLFSTDKLEQKRKQLPKEPIFLLPLLFPEFVLTTNYDETLETVYRESGHPFQSILLPGHPELLNQFIRQGGASGLLKLHGTLSGGLIEYGKIVFTLDQYDRHYGKRSPLTCDLKTCFEDRIILFLGCSLENDRTMELLQAVLQPGRNYYAIINCEKSERDEKTRQLGRKHIRAILYEKDRHEAVRVILEHLLEEYDSNTYDRLPVHVGALASAYIPERFSYKAEIIPFTGRRHELQCLNSFLGDAGTAFRWWAVIGPGGIGKSRLAYEFQKQLPQDWVSYYLTPADYANLTLLAERFPQKTLVIADYVQENAKAIGKWMEQLYEKKRSLPIRVLLVERQTGGTPEDSAWTKQLYADVFHEQNLKYACYQKRFLALQPLPDNDLLEIIENYTAFLQQNICQSGNTLPVTKEILLQKLKSVDPGLCRPLYAMFLTVAYMEGENPEHWNSNDILDYLITREQKRLKLNIQQTLGNSDENLYAACTYLQVVATVLQDSSIEQLQQLCPETWDIIAAKADCFVSPVNMLEQFGLAINDKIPALRPDLVGEYLVCHWLFEHPDKNLRFLSAVWQNPAGTTVFFHRMLHDYYDLFNFSPKRWELILPEDLSLSKRDTLLYASFIANAIKYCNIITECKRQVNLLECLTLDFPDSPMVVPLFAAGLYILSKKQVESDALQTLARLEHLAIKYNGPHNNLNAVLLARALVDFSHKQTEPTVQQIVTRLERLAIEHCHPFITISHAMGLLILSTKQSETNSLQTLAHLECLALKHREIPQISVILAKGLFYLSCIQDNSLDLQQTVTRLERLAAAYSNVSEIAVCFAKSLVNLSYSQDKSLARQAAIRLKCLAIQYPQIPGIAEALSRL